MKSNSTARSTPSDGRLFALLTACFYALFTLLPDSHSLMVQWPWVLIWQVGLLCPVFWLLAILWQKRQLPKLGLGFDWLVSFSIIGLIVSTILAEFPNQARWYGWVVLCLITTLYAVNSVVDLPQNRYALLSKQGYLNIAFIILSLFLWTTQTLLPELGKLTQIKQKYGIDLPFDFSEITLRNWAPIGHQNYVAGYLLLALPLLVGLSIIETGRKRWLWLTGIGLGLIDLYTTSSRGGWLGLFILVVFGLVFLLFRSKIPRLWLALGGLGGLGLLCGLALANNRLRTLIIAILKGETGGGELAYRIINAATGWQMGISHPLSGIGMGNVPLAYQKYRPFWAGRESELAYQLHSTPVQLWAEMGIWGIIIFLGLIILLIYPLWSLFKNNSQFHLEHPDFIILFSLYGGLFAYGIISLTDYQLDNLSISGTLVIYLACIVAILKPEKQAKKQPKSTIIFYTILVILLVVLLWLIPIHRAWQLSSQGFMALNQNKKVLSQNNLKIFIDNLSQANKLASWEPYYPYQLGWNLGNIALTIPNSQVKQQFISESIKWFQESNKVSPYQEFGQSNLGWLLLLTNPQEASQSFAKASQLLPAKRGIMYGLGLSLLGQQKNDLAIEAFTLEILRNPLFITSPLWNSSNLQNIYPQVLEHLINRYKELLDKYPQSSNLTTTLHQSRGGVYWWKGDLKSAHNDLDKYGTPLSKSILMASANNSPSPLPNIDNNLVIQAWNNPSQRSILLKQAWIQVTKTPLPLSLEKQLITSMEKSHNFGQWLKENAPNLTYRREREGFGVLSRHIDGSIPQDFLVVVDNAPMNTWFNELLPSPIYEPELDKALQPWRKDLIEKLIGK